MLHPNLTYFKVESTCWKASIRYKSSTLHDICPVPPNLVTPLNNVRKLNLEVCRIIRSAHVCGPSYMKLWHGSSLHPKNTMHPCSPLHAKANVLVCTHVCPTLTVFTFTVQILLPWTIGQLKLCLNCVNPIFFYIYDLIYHKRC